MGGAVVWTAGVLITFCCRHPRLAWRMVTGTEVGEERSTADFDVKMVQLNSKSVLSSDQTNERH